MKAEDLIQTIQECQNVLDVVYYFVKKPTNEKTKEELINLLVQNDELCKKYHDTINKENVICKNIMLRMTQNAENKKELLRLLKEIESRPDFVRWLGSHYSGNLRIRSTTFNGEKRITG